MLGRRTSAAAAIITLMAGAAVWTASPSAAHEHRPPTLPVSLKHLLNATCTAAPNDAVLLGTRCSDVAGGAANELIESFVSTSMPPAGRLTVRGVDFIWPGQTYGVSPSEIPPQRDTILDGKTPIPLGDRSGYKSIAVLVAGFGGNFDRAPYTVTYADGSRVITPLWLRSWDYPQTESDIPGIRIQQVADTVNETAGDGAIHMCLIPIDPRRAVRSLSLPDGNVHTLTYAVSLTDVDPPGGGPLDGPRYTVKGPIEAMYQAAGPWRVTKITTSAACDRDGDRCDIYYPRPIGRYPHSHRIIRAPIIAWANGSGQTAANYDYYLRHLASWGFVIVASRATGTGDGHDAVDSAVYLIRQAHTRGSRFFGKVATKRVGVAGHSQGGGSVVSLFAHQIAPFSAYVAIHPAPSYFCLLVCNLKPSDFKGARHGAILYLQSMGDGGAGDTQNYYEMTPSSALKAFGVLTNAQHNDIMGNPHCNVGTCVTGIFGYLGYSTAWFVWRLRATRIGRAAFGARHGEFMRTNGNWSTNLSDVKG